MGKKNLSLGADSANTYLSEQQCRASTLRKKQLMLQTLLQQIIDPSIKLNKIRMRISFTPKYALSDKEIADFLEEQKNIDSEDYLIQRLMLRYGLRVNTLALLKIKDLEFLDGGEKKIHLPDSKVKNFRTELIEDSLIKLLKKHVATNDLNSPDQYVFYLAGKNKSDRKRAYDLCIKINKRIKDSKVLKKNKNYKFSSHMFRKTRAYNMFHKELNVLKEKVRESIGQSQGSTAIESYIN